MTGTLVYTCVSIIKHLMCFLISQNMSMSTSIQQVPILIFFFFIFSDLKFLIQMHLLESYYRLPYIQTCFMCHLFLRFLYKIIDLLFFDFAFCWRKLALNSSFYLTRWHDMWVKSRWLRTKLANHLRWNNWIWIVPLW